MRALRGVPWRVRSSEGLDPTFDEDVRAWFENRQCLLQGKRGLKALLTPANG
jgi:hypothetical protein